MRRGHLTRVATPITPGAQRPARPTAASSAGRGADAQASSGAHEGGGTFEKEVLQEGLTPTFWFEPADRGRPYAVSIRFTGSRVGVVGKPQPGDHFDQLETVEGIVPGSGPISLTPQVRNINPGQWIVRAEPISRKGQERLVRPYPRATSSGQVRPMLWPRGIPSTPSGAPIHMKTRLIAFANRPGLITGSWPALVLLGFAVTVALQAVLIARMHLDVASSLVVTVVASLVGLLGAKLWFLALQPRTFHGLPSQGLCIQGFILGAAATATAGLALLHLPIGNFLDATAPGLFFGMLVGRPGCFFTGCCAGRPTASRWGIWSSDGRVGVRRIPTQLLESALSLGIGSVALLLVLLARPVLPGAIFVGGVAGYTLGRQFLLPFRTEPRKSAVGRLLTIAGAGAVLIADVLISIVASVR